MSPNIHDYMNCEDGKKQKSTLMKRDESCFEDGGTAGSWTL